MVTVKPDYDEACRRWMHFWRGELLDRPLVMAAVPKDPGTTPANPTSGRYYRAVHGQWNEQLALLRRMMDETLFLGERMPCFSPDFGPDQFAAFFGAELKFSPGSRDTNWVDPIIEDWDRVLPLTFDPRNATFQRLLQYIRTMAADADGRYLVAHIDKHCNGDALSALRGPERLCMDFFDHPDHLRRAMLDIRKAYKPVWDAVYEAGRMGGGGRGCCHYGLWHERDFAVVSADVICLLGADHFREYILPALEEEVAMHDAVFFHLDGPGALRHLDDILAIPGNWILQWVPGAGQPANFQWLEVLKKAQLAGKSVIVYGDGATPLDRAALQQLHRELDPARVVYQLQVKTPGDYEDAIAWLRRNM